MVFSMEWWLQCRESGLVPGCGDFDGVGVEGMADVNLLLIPLKCDRNRFIQVTGKEGKKKHWSKN